MAQDRSAMLLGFTRSGRPVWAIAGGAPDEGAPADGAAPEAPSAEEQAAAKAALDIVKAMKDAGVDDPTGALETIKKLREFEKGTKLPAKIEKELNDLREAAKAAADGKLTAEEQTTKLITDLQNQVQEATTKAQARVAKSALKASAAAKGALYPDDVPMLVDAASLEFDADGNPTNTDSLVEELKKSRPALFGTAKPSFDGGARGGGAPPKKDMESLMREAAGH